MKFPQPHSAEAFEPWEPSTPLLGRGRRRGARAGFGEASWLSQVSTGLKDAQSERKRKIHYYAYGCITARVTTSAFDR